MSDLRRSRAVACGAVMIGALLCGCSSGSDDPSTADLSPGTSAKAAPVTSPSDATSRGPLKLSKADEKMLQDALGAPGDIQVSSTGTVKPGMTDGFDDASAKPGVYTVKVTCGLGVGKVQVSITPDASKSTTITHTVDCVGDHAVFASGVYTGTFGTARGVHVKNIGSAEVAYGLAIVSQNTSATSPSS